MKSLSIYFTVILLLLCFISCKEKNKVQKDISLNETSVPKDHLPQDAIPFISYGHIYLPSAINDSLKGYYIFDTGGDYLYMDHNYFKQSGIKPKNIFKSYLGGAGMNRQEVKVIRDSTLFQSTGYKYHFDSYIVLDLRNVVGCRADGVIGLQSFLKSPLEVNSEYSYLRIFKDSLPSIKGYLKLPLKIEDNRLYTQLTVCATKEKTIKGWFLIDLGMGGYVCITSPVAKKFQLSSIPKKQIRLEMIYGGVGGESTSYLLRSNYITLGKDTLKNVPVEYSLDTQGALSSTQYSGLIGNSILKQYNLLFDFKGNALYLKPISADKSHFFLNKWQFIYSNRTDISPYWIVNGIYKDSNADKAGLNKGDSISHINGRAVSTIDWEEERTMKVPDKLNLTVKTKTGIVKKMSFDTSEDMLP